MLIIPDEVPSIVDSILAQEDSYLVISISGGKDSYAMLNYLMMLIPQRGWRCRVVAVFADLGRAEWPGTPELVAEQANDVGVELAIVRNKKGDMVDIFWQRWEKVQGRTIVYKGKDKQIPPFSDSRNRFCTSETKTTPIDIFIRHLPTNKVVCCDGIRSEESLSREKRSALNLRTSCCTLPYKDMSLEAITVPKEGDKGRLVLGWSPIKERLLPWVWEWCCSSSSDVDLRRDLMQMAQIKAALRSWKLSYSYLLGASRHSCALCILASNRDIQIGASYNQDLHENYVRLETESGTSFRVNYPLSEVQLLDRIMSTSELARLMLKLRN